MLQVVTRSLGVQATRCLQDWSSSGTIVAGNPRTSEADRSSSSRAPEPISRNSPEQTPYLRGDSKTTGRCMCIIVLDGFALALSRSLFLGLESLLWDSWTTRTLHVAARSPPRRSSSCGCSTYTASLSASARRRAASSCTSSGAPKGGGDTVGGPLSSSDLLARAFLVEMSRFTLVGLVFCIEIEQAVPRRAMSRFSSCSRQRYLGQRYSRWRRGVIFQFHMLDVSHDTPDAKPCSTSQPKPLLLKVSRSERLM